MSVSVPSVVAADDEDLLRRFAGGDVRAFEELYRRHLPVVLRRLTRLCGNTAIAEELAQEAFLRAAQRITPDREMNFRAYLLRIGTNLGIDHLRVLRRQPVGHSLDSGMEVRAAPGAELIIDTESDIDRREDARFVGRVLDRLNPRHRQVLIHRELEGLDYRTIAERMQISSSAVETLLFRARGRFREEYTRLMAQ